VARAIPLIASVAAAALIPEGYAVFGLSATASAALISGAAGLAAGFVVQSLSRPPTPDLTALLASPGAGRTQQVRQPIAPLQFTFGRIKASGPIVAISTADDDDGRTNGYLYILHGLAGHHCEAIGDVFLGDDLATDAKYNGLVRVNKHLGAADQVADADLVSELPAIWTTDHRLRGRAYIATRLKWDNTAFASGIPNIACILWGSDEVYDPRTGLTGWSNNAALCIAKWFTMSDGMGLAWSLLYESSVIAAANVCDERVRVKSGSAVFTAVMEAGSPTVYTGALSLSADARSLDVGDGVRLTTTGALPAGFSTGTTYYAIPSDGGTIKLASTVANAMAGTAITPTSSGTGTQTLIYWDEARYKLNGQFTLDAAKGDVLKQLLSAMAGVAVYIGGKWFLHAGAAAMPTITLDEDDLRSDYQWVPKRSMRDRFNTVRAVYPNPDANWQPVDAPPRTNADYVEEDADEELSQDARFPYTLSTRGVQRLQKIALELNRRQGVFTFPAKLTAMRLQPWDGVLLSIARYGWVQKQFRVIGWTLADDGGGVDLVLQEDDADVYAWTSAEEIDSAIQQGVVLPDPSTIAAPAEVTVTTPETPTFENIAAQWSEVANIWNGGYDVEYRVAGGTDWTGYGRVGPDVSLEVSLERTAPQDVRVRAVTKNGSPSEFAENLAPSAPTSPLATGGVHSIQIDATFGVDTHVVQLFEGVTFADSTLLVTLEPDYFPYTHSGLGDAESHTYWLRAVNSGGNFSAPTTTGATTL
jgi:hypothetical protein